MRPSFKLKLLIYSTLLGTVVWQFYSLYKDITKPETVDNSNTVVVDVYGNVKHPGKYRVPFGTTKFEILKVADIDSNSALTPLNLSEQVKENETINVKKRNKKVSLNNSIRMEFYYGTTSILDKKGQEKIIREGAEISEGDRVLTEENAQAEISLNSFSRIDLDNYSEVTFDKLAIDKNGDKTIEMFQKTGMNWYKLSNSNGDEKYTVITPLVKVSMPGKSADFTISSKYSETVINCNSGLILVQRPDGSDPMNVVAGQSITISNDGRPFSVNKISRNVSVTQKFNGLTQAKADLMLKHMPLNMMFFSPPFVNIMLSIQFDKAQADIIKIPPQTSIGMFVQGLETIQEAYLYGGPVFVSTMIERILNTRIPKYISMDKSAIIHTASSIGGVRVKVDPKAASTMKIKSKKQLLGGNKLATFLLPNISGYEDSGNRQLEVVKSIFDMVKSRDIVITALLAKQILSSAESNILPEDAVKYYKNFMEKRNWKIKTHTLPVIEHRDGKKIEFDPDFTKSREIIK